VALVLPAAGGDRMPEALGLLAGPGVFAIVVATNSDYEPTYWYAAGAVIVGAVLAAYVVLGRARCAARTNG
jgi:small neutral amino acid transporter SnatA (MarC family)